MTMQKYFMALWLSLLVAGAWAGEYDKYYEELPTEVAQVTVPEIPQNVVRLTDCGGKGDGVTLNTEAFKEATKTTDGDGRRQDCGRPRSVADRTYRTEGQHRAACGERRA